MSPDPAFTLPGRFRAAVFDVDGLLVATEATWAAAETALLAAHGDEHTEADRQATIGRSVAHSIEVYRERLRLPESAHDALRAELMAHLRARLTTVEAQPGARALVTALHGRMPLAVASASPREIVVDLLAGAGLVDAFEVVVSGDDVANGKPAPDPYLLACRRLGVDPRDAVAFEDSGPGIAAAVAAGLFCVAVPSDSSVDPSAAHLVLASLEAVAVGPG
jgi:HAD superfamily hydrolase (TIGR01509 family)